MSVSTPLPTRVDVVVVGAGPAGLGVGAEMSRDHHVLVLEKTRKLRPMRSWFVPNFTVEGDDPIAPYLYPGVKRFLIATQGGAKLTWDATLPGGYSYIRERELLSHWERRIFMNASAVVRGCSYIGHRTTSHGVEVQTSQGPVLARLLVDASGHDSPVVAHYQGEIACDYWWSVFGCIAEHPQGLGPDLRVGDYMVWQTFPETGLTTDSSLHNGRPVFEYEVLDDRKSFPLLLYLRTAKVPGVVMKRRFEQILRTAPTTKAFHDCRVVEYKCGWYPSGGLPSGQARDRVAFIGDAGGWTTPCGWGMGFILNNYRPYAAALGRLLATDRLHAPDINQLIDDNILLRRQIEVNRVMTHFLAYAPAADLDRFIGVFDRLDPGLVERIYTLTITPREIAEVFRATVGAVSPRKLLQLMAPHERRVVAGALGRLGQEVVLSALGRDVAGGKERMGRGFDITRGP